MRQIKPAIVLCVMFLASAVFADEIYLTSGETLTALVVEEHHDRIVLSTEGGEKTILRSQVEEVFYAEPEQNYLYLGNQALDGRDFSLARGFFRKALQINPRFGEAEDALLRSEDLERKGSIPLLVVEPLRAVEKMFGITLEAGDPHTLAAEVREGSSAQRSGILSGDALVAIWGYSLAFLAPKRVAAELAGPSGTQIKVTIKRVVLISGEAARGRSPFDLDMGRLGLTVPRVRPSTAADRAGLLPGDRIVRISQESTRYMPLSQAQRKIAEGRERGVRLVIHRDLMISRE